MLFVECLVGLSLPHKRVMHFVFPAEQAHHVTVIATLDKQTNKTAPPTEILTSSIEKKEERKDISAVDTLTSGF